MLRLPEADGAGKEHANLQERLAHLRVSEVPDALLDLLGLKLPQVRLRSVYLVHLRWDVLL
jgi:hypothetical protein